MQVKRSMFWAIALITLFLLQSTSPLLHPVGVESSEMEVDETPEWVQFDLVDGVYSDAVGYSEFSSFSEQRDMIASSRIGTFDLTVSNLNAQFRMNGCQLDLI